MIQETPTAFLGSMICVSACGLIYVALMNRYSVLVPQIRTHQLHPSNRTPQARQLIHRLLRRAKLMQWILILLSFTIVIFLLGVLHAGLSSLFQIQLFGFDSLIVFLIGISTMILTMTFSVVETFLSLNTL
jgi:hypothetical protein